MGLPSPLGAFENFTQGLLYLYEDPCSEVLTDEGPSPTSGPTWVDVGQREIKADGEKECNIWSTMAEWLCLAHGFSMT